jgi:hypothetical protein
MARLVVLHVGVGMEIKACGEGGCLGMQATYVNPGCVGTALPSLDTPPPANIYGGLSIR